MRELEKIFKALANRRRLEIVRYLKATEEATVGSVARHIKLSFRATSRHLLKLAACDILEREQRIVEVYYRLARNQAMEMKKNISTI